MRPDNEISGSTTATTSTSGRKARPDGKPADQPFHPESNEADYLAQQASEAKAAIARTFSDMASQLGDSADVRLWTKQYPWLTLASTTVAAFVATSLLVPSREQRALNKLAAIERALNPTPPPAPKVDSNGENAAQYKPGGNSLMTTLARELIGAVKPAVISLLTAGVTAAQTKPTEAEMRAAAAKEEAGLPPSS